MASAFGGAVPGKWLTQQGEKLQGTEQRIRMPPNREAGWLVKLASRAAKPVKRPGILPGHRIQLADMTQGRVLSYLLGAPGVGTPVATCAPLACACLRGALKVMPLPDTCTPAACVRVSAAVTVIVEPDRRALTNAMTAVS